MAEHYDMNREEGTNVGAHWSMQRMLDGLQMSKIQQENGNVKIGVQRFKGLGEMDPEQLWESTMNPKNRVMLKLTMQDAALADETFTILMGDKVEPRKEWIDENVIFTLEDNYEIGG